MPSQSMNPKYKYLVALCISTPNYQDAILFDNVKLRTKTKVL